MDTIFQNCVDFCVQRPLTIFLACVVFYFIFIWESRVTRLLNKFPGPTSYPILGNAHMAMDPENVVPMLLEWLPKFGSRFRVFISTFYGMFVATSPEDVEKILTSTVIIDKSLMYLFIRPWLGDGLLLSSGKKWHSRRKALTPAFHFRILDNFLPIMNEQSKIFVDVLLEGLSTNQNNEEIDLQPYIARCTLDIICETAMGKKLNCQQDLENLYAIATLKETSYFWYRCTRPWLYLDAMWSLSWTGREEKANLKILHDFTNQVIKERKSESILDEHQNGGKSPTNLDTEGKPGGAEEDDSIYYSSKRRFAFLDLLIREQAKGDQIQLTDQDIRDEVDTFMFEGHDTTAAAISWTIFLLGLHPEHQETVHQELDSIFGDDPRKDLTSVDLTKMKFLEYCIKESLRLFPSVPTFGRQLYQDFYLADGAVVPKGATVMVLPFMVHRNPEVWPDPEEFRPSRFFPENSTGRHPYAYIPFSGGMRNCIGQKFAYMEEKAVLGHLFKNFKIESLDTRESIRPLMEVVMRPKNGIRVKLTRR